jgi:hypothetical protein
MDYQEGSMPCRNLSNPPMLLGRAYRVLSSPYEEFNPLAFSRNSESRKVWWYIIAVKTTCSSSQRDQQLNFGIPFKTFDLIFPFHQMPHFSTKGVARTHLAYINKLTWSIGYADFGCLDCNTFVRQGDWNPVGMLTVRLPTGNNNMKKTMKYIM